jgi:hypothetical protein
MSFTAPSPAEITTDHTSRLLHIYDCWEHGGRCPDIGDKALCGYERTTPPNAGIPFERRPDACVVCISLWEQR